MVNNGSSVSAGFAAGAVNQNAGEVRNRNIWRPKTILEPRSFRLAPDLSDHKRGGNAVCFRIEPRAEHSLARLRNRRIASHH